MPLWKKFVLGAGGGLALLFAVIAIRTAGYGAATHNGTHAALPEGVAVDSSAAAQHLGEAIRFRTVSTTEADGGVDDPAPWRAFHDWLESTYPSVHLTMTRETLAELTLLYRWEGSDPALAPLILMAHQDVVPADAADKRWTAPPFDGRIVDGMIIGRGTLDDKGSLIALMEASEALIADGFAPRRTVYFLFGHDEEVGGSGAEAAFTALARRGVSPVAVIDEGLITVDPNPVTGKPTSIIGVAEKGYLTLTLTARGEGGHSSLPPTDGAAFRLARALTALEERPLPSHIGEAPVEGFFRALAADLPVTTRMALANRWLLGGMVKRAFAALPAANAMVRTTTAPTMLRGSPKDNVLPAEAVATVNFRVHPADSIKDVVAHVEATVAGIEGISVDIVEGTEPMPVAPMGGAAFDALSTVARGLSPSAPVVPGLVLGATDSRHARELTPYIYRYMPIVASVDDIAGIHGAGEAVSIDNLMRMVTGYQQLIKLLDAAPSP